MERVKKQVFISFLKSQKGNTFVWTIVGIAAIIIVGAFVFIPQLKDLSATMMKDTTTWWSTIKDSIFQTSST
jgi:hypothetical protein